MTNSTPSHAQRPWLFGLLLTILPAVTHAAMSFEAALKRALQESPMLAASAARIDAARLAAIPAGELPDPKLALGIDNLPVDGPDRFSLTRDFMTMRRIGVMQEVPNRAKRDARVSAAQGRTALAEAEAAIVRSTVRRETALAWITRHSVERQLAKIGALAEENRLLVAAVHARLAGGQGRASEIVAPPPGSGPDRGTTRRSRCPARTGRRCPQTLGRGCGGRSARRCGARLADRA